MNRFGGVLKQPTIVTILLLAASVHESRGYDCSNLPTFLEKEYERGEKTVHRNKAFKCKRNKAERCGLGGKYEPGVGSKSRRAWISLGSCSGHGDPNGVVTAKKKAPKQEAKSKGPKKECRGAGIDFTSYDYQYYVEAASVPPVSLDIAETPQFVSLTFDDNGYSGLNEVAGGMDWVVNMLANKKHNKDKSKPRATFFHTSQYISEWMYESPTYVKRAWNEAKAAGHEVGLHSHDHSNGEAFSAAEWSNQIHQCVERLTEPFDPREKAGSPKDKAGIGARSSEVSGWRTPFLNYNENLFEALVDNGVAYDASIEDGWQPDHNGENYNWPYTLDNGSPGHDVFVSWGSRKALKPQPGLFETPVHPFIVPPDSEAKQYGISPGLRRKCKGIASWFDESSGKITGFDYNLLVQFRMTAKEFSATLKYTLDLRVKGNRAPFFVGLHSDTYSDAYTAADDWSTAEERRRALSDFIDYALSKSEVRMVTARDVLNWVRDPVPLACLVDK